MATANDKLESLVKLVHISYIIYYFRAMALQFPSAQNICLTNKEDLNYI